MPSIHAVDYLKKTDTNASVRVAYGDLPFFQRLVLLAWKREFAEGEDDLSCIVYQGAAAEPAAVLDALASRSLFGGGRQLVIVEDADPFVSKHRAHLETYFAKPSTSSVLALTVKSWPSNTRLAKMTAESGLAVECSTPAKGKLSTWLKGWAQSEHHCKLDADGADLLIDIVGEEPGLLNQELAKLALVAEQGKISASSIEQHAGGWRVKTAWSMLDAALAGSSASALEQLDKLLDSGESPIGILAQLASSLRKFMVAARTVERKESQGRKANLREALETSGFKSFTLDKVEQQLRKLGRKRALQLGHWLLETDLALKGPASAPARSRLALEQFVLRLAAPAAS